MDDILTEIQTLKADYKAAQDLLEVSASNVEELKQQVSQATEASQAVAATINAKDAEIVSLLAELEQHKQQIATLEAAHKTAEEKAVAIVAAQGVAPIAVKPFSAQELTKQEALAHYKELLGKDSFAAGAFYQKNKATLCK